MFAKRLKELREATPYNQAETAKNLGISSVTYNRYEKGERTPDLITIKMIAEYFSVTTDYLLGASDVQGAPSQNVSDTVIKAFREIVIPHIREETIKTFGPDAPSVRLCDEIDTFPIEQQKVFFNDLVKRFYFDEKGVIQFELHEPTDKEATTALAELTDEQMAKLVQSLSRDGRRKLLKIIANTDD